MDKISQLLLGKISKWLLCVGKRRAVSWGVCGLIINGDAFWKGEELDNSFSIVFLHFCVEKICTFLNGKRHKWVQRKGQRSAYCLVWATCWWNTWSSGLLWAMYISLYWSQPGSWTPWRIPHHKLRWSFGHIERRQAHRQWRKKPPPWRKHGGHNILQARSRVHPSPWGSQLHGMYRAHKGLLSSPVPIYNGRHNPF